MKCNNIQTQNGNIIPMREWHAINTYGPVKVQKHKIPVFCNDKWYKPLDGRSVQ